MPTDAVLITVATSMEIAPFLEQIKGVHGHTLLPGVKVFTGCLYKRKLQVLITGPGMVNTAMALGAFLLQHRPGLIIQTGIAGFFPDQGLGPGDLAIATAQMDIHSRVESANTVDTVGTVHHPLPFALCTAPMVGSDGQLAMHPGLVSATQTLLSRAMAPGAAPVVTGPFITVSTLTTAPSTIVRLARTYCPIMEAMEGAAAAQAAARYHIPFLEIRSGSNPVGLRDKSQWCIPRATRQTAVALHALLEKGDSLWDIILPPGSG